MNLIIEVVHIVLWKLRRPSVLTSTPTEEVLAKAKEAISALKSVPGPETVGDLYASSNFIIIRGRKGGG